MNSFVLVWFECSGWWVLFGNGESLAGGGSVGYALNTALRHANAAEADFECVVDYVGEFYRYERE